MKFKDGDLNACKKCRKKLDKWKKSKDIDINSC